MILKPHRHPGIFIAEGKESLLVTKNLVPGEAVYGEKRISSDGGEEGAKIGLAHDSSSIHVCSHFREPAVTTDFAPRLPRPTEAVAARDVGAAMAC